MSHSKECVGCQATVPDDEISSYSLIGTGWRLSRTQTATGAVVEWRCPACWTAYKASQARRRAP